MSARPRSTPAPRPAPNSYSSVRAYDPNSARHFLLGKERRSLDALDFFQRGEEAVSSEAVLAQTMCGHRRREIYTKPTAPLLLCVVNLAAWVSWRFPLLPAVVTVKNRH